MWQRLKQATKPIVLYGMGDGADKVLSQCHARNIPVAGVFASNSFARHNRFHKFTVISYSEAKEKFGSMIVLVCFGTHLHSVMHLIDQVATEQELYIPDVPVAGDVIFDAEFAIQHREQLNDAYKILADEVSRQTFRDLVSYKLSGRCCYLNRCQMPKWETYTDLLRLGNNEHYADLGAYRGDTVADFLQVTTNQYGSILAVEPDPGSFKKLQQFTSALPRCQCIQAVMTNTPGNVLFQAGRGRGSSTGKAGIPIQAESLDHLLQHKPISFLNIDVEGNESLVLAGAKHTINTWRPKILLSAYHRSEDLFMLPLQIQKIRSDYRVYLRHWPCYPAWDVNYIFT